MTAIAGIMNDGKVYIGGDSAGVGGLSMQTRSDPKVFKNGEFIFGYTSSFRMGQLLEHEFSPPKPFEGEEGMPYMVKRFIPAVRGLMKGGGYQETRNGQEYGGTFLVGWRGQLYEIEGDYQVARVRQSYHACGCGQDLVLGSLHATDSMKIAPKKRIEMALQAASEFSAGVRGPYTVLSI
ncbi:hypothetical protein HCU74_08210 [Spongiibacter sp. KMU-166]|uniref:Uncharacterized protein n=1 Tax=Spongiibacter thalassae TaxID=2721624 RepID=A0ABX1GE15_9GAMM|nr:hypothetical protein [Spongiibacter thalassae]NKI17398.1 hypothetical protein [Spongiibacter thalassae]